MSRLARALHVVSRALHARERLDIGLRAHGQPGARWWESQAELRARFERAIAAASASDRQARTSSPGEDRG